MIYSDILRGVVQELRSRGWQGRILYVPGLMMDRIIKENTGSFRDVLKPLRFMNYPVLPLEDV